MPTYRIEATAAISTTIEAEGSINLSEDVDNFSDDTNYDYQEVTQEIAFSFDVKARNDEDAWDKGRDAAESADFESYQDLGWEISDVEIQGVERTSGELTLPEAIEVVREFLGNADVDSDVEEAMGVVLDNVEHLAQSVTTLQATVESLRAAVVPPFEPGEPPAQGNGGNGSW